MTALLILGLISGFVLFGIALGIRHHVIVLIPATVSALLFIAALSVAAESALAVAVWTAIAGVCGLQAGFVAGALMQDRAQPARRAPPRTGDPAPARVVARPR